MEESEKAEIEKIIKTLADRYKDGNYIFRGMRGIPTKTDNYKKYKEEYKKKIISSLYKKYLDYKDLWSEYFTPADAEKEIVKETKIQLQQQYNNSTNIEILTDLRHYGAAVTLIDFSFDIYTALFFACNGEFKKPGELVMLEISKIAKIGDINYKNPTFGIIKPAQTATSQKRVASQKSIFVYAPDGFIPKDSCIIEKIKAKDKKGILSYLKEHPGINQNSIYNDLIGFIENEENYESSQVEFYKGLSHHRKEEFEKAIEFYGRAIELKPNLPEAYINRGIAKHKLGNHQEAIDDCDEAIKLDPNLAEAYVNRGAARNGMGDYQGTIDDCTTALALDSNDAEAYATRGFAKNEMGNHQGAIDDCDEAIRLDSNNVGAYVNRGAALYWMKYYQRAINDCDETIRLDSNNVNAYMNRGSARYGLKKYKEAIEDWEMAIKLNPNYEAELRRQIEKAKEEIKKTEADKS